ncbi:hypothetical protein B5M09_003458 [Aphanomyces astaci]|uniref:Hyaluronan/mRNA-binding protein domain-containing protein n=1 Tax=Aphanomyces astaci TaxID=112090 RepID=A0A3R7X3G5_APHAT|nr:hypothetical protein B5M09_003458 [Aphanomyces astaci]
MVAMPCVLVRHLNGHTLNPDAMVPRTLLGFGEQKQDYRAQASHNIFAALDSDDEDTKTVQVPASKVAEPTKPKTVKARKEGEQPAKKQDGGRNGGRGGRGEGRGGREGGRGGRGEGRGPRPDGERTERAPRPEGERRPRSERAPRADRPEGSTGTNLRAERERGERPDRSHHHAEGGERTERKRNFDRKSGTGRGKEVSKSGGGARNWGNEDDKTEQAAEAAVDEAVADEAKEIAAEDAVPEVAVVEEEVDNTITYEEYLASKKSSRSNDELFADKELRTVENEFESAALITKHGKTPDFIESNFEKVFTKKTSGRKKNLVTDVGFTAPSISGPRFDREDREDRPAGGRGGRGGRGEGARGGRGGRGAAGAGRGDVKKSKANAPNVSDVNAFPSL